MLYEPMSALLRNLLLNPLFDSSEPCWTSKCAGLCYFPVLSSRLALLRMECAFEPRSSISANMKTEIGGWRGRIHRLLTRYGHLSVSQPPVMAKERPMPVQVVEA